MTACADLSNNFSVFKAEDVFKLIENSETRNTVKFSCYKASKGFENTGKQFYDSEEGRPCHIPLFCSKREQHREPSHLSKT